MANVFLLTTNGLNLAQTGLLGLYKLYGVNSFNAIASESHYGTPKPIVVCSQSELIKRDSSSTPGR